METETTKMMNKNVIWNTIGTSANAFLSLFFLIIVTRINGVEDAGIFSFSFSNACILSVVGMYMGRTYQVSYTGKDITDSDYIYSRCFTCVLMILISGIMLFINQYSPEKSIIFMSLTVYKMLEAFSDVIYGIVQKNGCLYMVGKSFFIKAVLSFIVFVIVDMITRNLLISCIGICIVMVAVILFYDMANIKKMNVSRSRFSKTNIMALFKGGFAICITTLLSNYIVSAAKYAIDMRGMDEFQAIFGIILMPATVLSLLGQFIIHPSLLNLTKAYSKRAFTEMKRIVYRMIGIMVGFGILAVLAAAWLGIPVLEILYGISLDSYRMELILIMAGAIFYGIAFILLSLLTVMRYTVVQMYIYVFLAVCAFVSSYFLVEKAGISGAAYSYIGIMVSEAVIYGILSFICVKKEKKKAVF